MTKRAEYALLGGLMLVVFAAVVGRYSAQTERPLLPSGSVTPNHTSGSFSNEPIKREESKIEPGGRLVPAEGHTDAAREIKADVNNDSQPVESDADTPNAVVGRPFPISASVDAACRVVSREGKDRCPEVHQRLREFAAEPRDSNWASIMETHLSKLVMTESERFTDVTPPSVAVRPRVFRSL